MKGVIRSIKNEINNYDEGERLVRELTSNERTPPSTQMLIKLKIMLTDQYQFPTIVRMLFKRLKDYNNIRHVEKSLIVIEYLIKNADRKFVRYCQMDKKSISKLQRYRYILGNNNGVPVDYGGNIRKRAKKITALLDEEEKLREQRAKAQGYSMQFKNKGNNSNKSKKSSNSKKGSSSSSSSAQKKKKPKKKKTKKKKEATTTTTTQQQQEPQYESFIDVPPDNNNNINQSQTQNNDNDDLLSGNWWKEEEEEQVFGGDGDEFEWFQGDTNEQQSGVGDDGGAFGFGNDDDFNDEEEQKDDGMDADSWMTSLTQMDNVLDGSIQKKDTNKRNTKGTSMAAMAKKNPSKQPINSAFGTDDFFNQNSGTNNNNNNNTGSGGGDFDPFGLGNSNQNNSGSAASNITSLYNQKPQNNINVFGGTGIQNNNGFGYQSKSGMPSYNNDPFAGIGGNANNIQPASTYISRKKVEDPFAQFGMK